MRPELTLDSRSGSLLAAGIAAVVSVGIALAIPAEGIHVSLANFGWVALASLAVTGFVVFRAGLWTATGAYAAVFWCFHFGLIAALGSGIVEPLEISMWDQLWVLGPFGGDAAVLALAGTIAFSAGVGVVQARAAGEPRNPELATSDPAHAQGVAGSILVLCAIAIWGGIVISAGGTAAFFGSYGDYLQLTADYSAPLSIIWLALGCGLVLSVTGERGWLRIAAIAAFGSFALVALPLGLRGEVMFPSLAALVGFARCGWKLTTGKTCVFAATLLFIIPAVREIRHTGVKGLPDLVMDLRVLDAFVEMGGSLHPVEKVVRWHAEGEPLEMGSSYWAPIERAAARILPGIATPAAEDDLRIMNVLVTERVGAIGFSPVAEAYRNFGALGVVVVLGLLGAALAALDRMRDRSLAVLLISSVYLSLLINVRNSFISVPAQCVLGLGFVAALGVIRHLSSSILCRPYARATYVRG